MGWFLPNLALLFRCPILQDVCSFGVCDTSQYHELLGRSKNLLDDFGFESFYVVSENHIIIRYHAVNISQLKSIDLAYFFLYEQVFS